ncbi:hypothetical protein VPHD528_0207 [Vibrio phage D528]
MLVSCDWMVLYFILSISTPCHNDAGLILLSAVFVPHKHITINFISLRLGQETGNPNYWGVGYSHVQSL